MDKCFFGYLYSKYVFIIWALLVVWMYPFIFNLFLASYCLWVFPSSPSYIFGTTVWFYYEALSFFSGVWLKISYRYLVLFLCITLEISYVSFFLNCKSWCILCGFKALCCWFSMPIFGIIYPVNDHHYPLPVLDPFPWLMQPCSY